MSVSCVVFDLGRTLAYIPSDYDLEQRVASLARVSKYQIELAVIRTYLSKLRMSSEEFIDLFSQKMHEEYCVEQEEVKKICQESIEKIELQPDSIHTLDALRKLGYKLGLISNTSPLTKGRLERLGLSRYFDKVVLSCDTGFLKPDPRIFLYAFSELDVRPEEVCLVGDSIRTLILGGSILGTNLILIERRMDSVVISEQMPVDAILPNLSELPTLIQTLNRA
ncbi:MAG: HAD family hydrolase [Candidatus Caldarchaeum sp.]